MAGSKVWSLYSPAIPHARSDEARLDETELATLPDGSDRPVEQEVVMKAGDMLYIPRGVPHTARNLRRHLSSTHLTVGTHVYLWQTLEGWAHRAAVLWLQRNRASSQARRLDEWLPVGAGMGAAAGLLHAAIRVAANAQPALRRGAVFANQASREEWTAAAAALCDGDAAKTRTIARAVRGWGTGSARGLGTVGEFTKGLRVSELARAPAEEDAKDWQAGLPFVGDGGGGETASEAYARGVHQALHALKEGGAAKASPRGAWRAVWRGFCESLQPADDELWEGLVAWHAEVRRGDREAVYGRWARNLEAAGLPPLRKLAALSLPE